MIRFCSIILWLIIVCPVKGQGEWQLRKQKDDISVYTRNPEESNLREYRAIGEIRAPLEDVYSFLSDLEGRPDWVINCTGLDIIDTAGQKIIYHTSYNIPWPMADRDLVVEAEIKMVPGSGMASLRACHTDIEYPLEDGVVRMKDYLEDVRLESRGDSLTMYYAQGFVDPAGKVPAWIVNMFLVDGIFDSVVKTREMCAARTN